MKFYSIKTERKNCVAIPDKEKPSIERLLRKAKLDGNKDKVRIFAEMLYSGKLIEDKKDKEKDEFYTLLVLDHALRKTDKLSKETETLKSKLIDNDYYFDCDIQENNLVAEDTEVIEVSSTSKLQKLENYPEELDPFVMDLIKNKTCKANKLIIDTLKELKIKFKRVRIDSYITAARKSINRALGELVIWLKKYQRLVMFSGGKDSAAMLIKLIEDGENLDKIIFADTRLEFPEMYQYIERVQDYIKHEITIVKGNITFDDWFYDKFTKGRHKGQPRGFPKVVGLGCWAKRELKVKPLQKAEGKGNEIFIGITADEKERAYRETYQHNNIYRFPLINWGLTGQDCINFLKERNLLNPLYEMFRRLGCWLCPKQGLESLKSLYKHYPELWDKLKKYEQDSPTGFKIDTTVGELEQRFKREIQLEENQLSLFQS